MISKTRIDIILAAVVVLLATPAAAQETIFDPENPAVQGAEEPEEDAEDAPEAESEDEGSDDDGAETIFDPENPAVDAEAPAEEGEDDVGDEQTLELAGPDMAVFDDGGGAGDEPLATATFVGEYATALAVDTAWEDLGAEGSAAGDVDGEDVVEWANRLTLGVDYELGESTRVVLSADFLHWMGGKENADEPDLLVNAAAPRAAYEARVGESYVLYRDARWTYRFGNLVTRWGATDLVRPGEVVNPTDLSRLDALAGGDLLLPQLAAEVGYTGLDWSVTGTVVPFFEPNEVVVFGRDTALANPRNPLVSDQLAVLAVLEELVHPSRYEDVQPLVLATEVPDETPENVSAGARFAATVANTDLGVGYFFGWDRTPYTDIDPELRELFAIAVDDGQVLRDFNLIRFAARNPEAIPLAVSVSQRANDGEELVSSTYRRRHTLVLDAARYLGPIGVRADLALSPEQTFSTRELQSVRRPTAFGALGLSWERLEDERLLAVTLEGFWLHPFARDSDVTELFVADAERGDPDSELLIVDGGLYGAAAAFNWTLPVAEVDLQAGGVYFASGGDWIATTALRRRWTSWLRTGVELRLFEGPEPAEELTLGGLYDHNDQVVLRVDGVF